MRGPVHLSTTHPLQLGGKMRPHASAAASSDQNGGPWRGLDDLEIATCGWVSWFNEERIHGELNDLTPAEVEDAYRDRSRPEAA
ncbi:MAG: hypothetical protein ACRD1K_03035 [Acidimicrobiales bacterium]